MKRRPRKFWHGLIFIAAIAAIAAITMLLWNALIPSIIGWSAINYWQAAGLLILSRLLFGGMFGGLRHRMHHHHRGGMHGRPFPGHLHDKMKGMSWEEKREYIRKRMDESFDERCEHLRKHTDETRDE